MGTHSLLALWLTSLSVSLTCGSQGKLWILTECLNLVWCLFFLSLSSIKCNRKSCYAHVKNSTPTKLSIFMLSKELNEILSYIFLFLIQINLFRVKINTLVKISEGIDCKKEAFYFNRAHWIPLSWLITLICTENLEQKPELICKVEETVFQLWLICDQKTFYYMDNFCKIWEKRH